MKNFIIKSGLMLVLITSLIACTDQKAEDAKIQLAVDKAVRIAVDSAVKATIQIEVKKAAEKQMSLSYIRRIAREESGRAVSEHQHDEDDLTQHMAGY